MDLTVLAKKISSYRTPSGKVTNLPNKLLAEILNACARMVAGDVCGSGGQNPEFRRNFWNSKG